MANSKTYITRDGGDANLDNVTVSGILDFAGALAGIIQLETQELTASGAINPNVSLVALNHASTVIAATRVAPKTGYAMIIINTSASGTAAHTVTLPDGVTWDGTNRVATLNAPDEALICIASSPTRYQVLVNAGGVTFS